jgi:chemotaxis protein CheZ
MGRTRQVFRIESMDRSDAGQGAERLDLPAEGGSADRRAEARHREILAAIAALRADPQPAQPLMDERAFERLRADMAEAVKLKAELDEMYEAIARTKRELATLHHTGFKSDEAGRVTDELDAVVKGTEHATESILAAAEIVDERASGLQARLSGEPQGMASDIQDQTVKIFEACNFQDLTGQRISKVVGALRFVEERVDRMMEIWGGLESFKDMVPEGLPTREGDAALLNGPALDGDEGVATQDEIDALFG